MKISELQRKYNLNYAQAERLNPDINALVEALRSTLREIDRLLSTQGFKEEGEWLGPFLQNAYIDKARATLKAAKGGTDVPD